MLSPPQADGDTALYVAAKAGHDEAVRALLEVQATKVDWQNHKGAQEMVWFTLLNCTALCRSQSLKVTLMVVSVKWKEPTHNMVLLVY